MTIAAADRQTTAPRAIGPGADELERAVAAYRAALPPGTLELFDIAPLDDLGLSVFTAAFAGADGFLQDGFGYGATAAEASVGALGEISETAHLDAALRTAPVTVASRREMVAAHGPEAVLDPARLCLPAGSDWTAGTPVAWVGVTRWPDGLAGVAPLECIATAPGQHRARAPAAAMLFRPITCGLGAGLSRAQALSHAVLELLQRDGNCTRFRAMDEGRVIDIADVGDPGLRALVARLEAAGIRPIAKLASTEFGLTNLYVVGRGGAAALPIMLTACGEAVHASPERALRKAMLEFIAARCRKAFMHGPLGPIRRIAGDAYLDGYAARHDPGAEEPRAMAEMTRWLSLDAETLMGLLADTVYAERERVPLDALPRVEDAAVADPDDRLADIAGRLAGEDIPVWYFDASPEGGAAGVHVVKAVAPGLEGETMSYHRIGARGAERLLARGVPFVGRAARPGWRRVVMTDAEEARLGGPVWLDPAGVDATVGRSYPLYREPSSHAVQFALGHR